MSVVLNESILAVDLCVTMCQYTHAHTQLNAIDLRRRSHNICSPSYFHHSKARERWENLHVFLPFVLGVKARHFVKHRRVRNELNGSILSGHVGFNKAVAYRFGDTAICYYRPISRKTLD